MCVPGWLSWCFRGTVVIEQAQLWQADWGWSISEHPEVVSSLVPTSVSAIPGGCKKGGRSSHQLGYLVFLSLPLLQESGGSHPALLRQEQRGVHVAQEACVTCYISF